MSHNLTINHVINQTLDLWSHQTIQEHQTPKGQVLGTKVYLENKHFGFAVAELLNKTFRSEMNNPFSSCRVLFHSSVHELYLECKSTKKGKKFNLKAVEALKQTATNYTLNLRRFWYPIREAYDEVLPYVIRAGVQCDKGTLMIVEQKLFPQPLDELKSLALIAQTMGFNNNIFKRQDEKVVLYFFTYKEDTLNIAGVEEDLNAFIDKFTLNYRGIPSLKRLTMDYIKGHQDQYPLEKIDNLAASLRSMILNQS